MTKKPKRKSRDSGLRKCLRIMKFSLLLFVFSIASLSAGVRAQSVVRDFRTDNATLLEVLKSIESKSGYTCLYSHDDVAGVKGLSFDLHRAHVTEILDRSLAGTSLEYEIVDDTIVIRSKAQRAQQPERRQLIVQGVVRDEFTQPVAGATVVWKENTSVGAATDREGRFSFAIPTGGQNAMLSVSFVGMKSKDVLATAADPVTVVLEEDQGNIEEVVVTGIFTRDVQSFTGSVVAFNQEELTRVGNQNVFQSLKNLDPSLMILESREFGSDPNKNPTMQLHGTSSFDLGELGRDATTFDLKGTYGYDPNAPLFILDGFEATVQKIMDLDMNRVESLTILKDASAKAIYGSKAANGVVVIETKKSTAGQLRITYTGSVDVQAPDLSSYNLLNAARKLEIEKDAGIYLPDPRDLTEDPIPLLRKYSRILTAVQAGVDTDWLAKPVRTGVGTKHAVSLELGTGDLRVIGDLSYNKVVGTMKGSDRTTTAGSVMVSYRHKKFNFRNILNISSNVGNDSPYGSFSEYARMNPYWSPYDENGKLLRNIVFQFSDDPETEQEFVANPLYNAQLSSLLRNEYIDVTNNSYVEWHILPGLKATGRFGITEKRTKADEFYPANHLKFISLNGEELFRRGSYNINEGWSKSMQADVNINGSHGFGAESKHVVFGNVGFELSKTEYEEIAYEAEGFPNEMMNSIVFARQFAKESKPRGRDSKIHNVGVLAVASYSYDYRYLVDASLRASASSQYGADSRWGQFWSFGLGWNIHNEKWMGRFEKLRELKLRGSVGYTGAQSSDVYAALASYLYNTGYTYDNFYGAYLKGMKNDQLKWEEKLDYNVGLDLRLGDALSLKFDYYIAETTNTLVPLTLPPSTGFAVVTENVGTVRNRGFDTYITWTPWRRAEQQAYFSLVGSLTHNTNKIVDISDALRTWNERQDAIYDYMQRFEPEASRPSPKYYEGASMNAIWAVRSLGIDPASGREVFLTKDGRKTDTYSAADQVVCGDNLPAYSGTLGFNFSWKGWGLNSTLRYRWGGRIYNQTVVDLVEDADLTYNVDYRVYEGRWRKPGDVKPYKNITTVSAYNNTVERTRPTSRFVEDSNELILSSVNLSYDFFDRTALGRLGLERLRLNFYMNDVFTWSTVRIERGTSYPFARNFSFSLQATF